MGLALQSVDSLRQLNEELEAKIERREQELLALSAEVRDLLIKSEALRVELRISDQRLRELAQFVQNNEPEAVNGYVAYVLEKLGEESQ